VALVFLESRWMDAKTGSLVSRIADLETIVVDNERERLRSKTILSSAINLNSMFFLRDDKTIVHQVHRAAKYRECTSLAASRRWLALFWPIFSG